MGWNANCCAILLKCSWMLLSSSMRVLALRAAAGLSSASAVTSPSLLPSFSCCCSAPPSSFSCCSGSSAPACAAASGGSPSSPLRRFASDPDMEQRTEEKRERSGKVEKRGKGECAPCERAVCVLCVVGWQSIELSISQRSYLGS